METWPVGLQQRLNVDNFSKKFGKTTVRSEVDVGVAKVRQRFTDAVDIYTCSINLDFSEYATFETFYKTQLGNGSLTFEFDDPFTQTPATFRFADDPTITPMGGRYFKVDMVWEKMP